MVRPFPTSCSCSLPQRLNAYRERCSQTQIELSGFFREGEEIFVNILTSKNLSEKKHDAIPDTGGVKVIKLLARASNQLRSNTARSEPVDEWRQWMGRKRCESCVWSCVFFLVVLHKIFYLIS